MCGNKHKGMWWESQLYAGQTLCTATDSLTWIQGQSGAPPPNCLARPQCNAPEVNQQWSAAPHFQSPVHTLLLYHLLTPHGTSQHLNSSKPYSIVTSLSYLHSVSQNRLPLLKLTFHAVTPVASSGFEH
jgi:hypothetical protein